MTDPKPCPFCGKTQVACAETSSYKWGAASCMYCGAVGPEVRKQHNEPADQWHPRALAEWNERASEIKR